MKNEFHEGQKVVCISENFPIIKKHGGNGKEAANTPSEEEVLVIDEILGEFLRFDKYDTKDSYNWWKSDRFAPITEEEIAMEEQIAEALSV